MKTRLLLVFILISFSATAQKKLTNSTQSSKYTYIYKLSDAEMLDIAIEGNGIITDRFFHTLIDSFPTNKTYVKPLAYGNYLQASAIKNKLNYTLWDEKNVELQFVNDFFNCQFYVKDLKGNLVENAVVELGRGKKAIYIPATKLYQSSYRYKDEVIKVVYEGVSNFFEYEIDDDDRYDREEWDFFKKAAYSFPIKYTWQPFKKLFEKKYKSRYTPPAYGGYLVFSKPKYKPLDTVKFKAYVLTAKGEDIKSIPVDVSLMNRDDTIKKITTLQPYRNGAYEYKFVLHDSLDMDLDDRYSIQLSETTGKKRKILDGSFKYEDYELKAITFNVRTDKEEHKIGAPVTVFLKATDENELAVPDGRVEIVARTRSISKYHDKHVFVPDTLWKKDIHLDPVGETKLVLPDSIFPKADVRFELSFTFRNSNNETKNQNKSLSYSYQDKGKLQEIKALLKKDSLQIDFKENDSSVKQQATLLSYTTNDVLIDSVSVTLPISIKADYRAEYYDVKMANGYKDSFFMSDFTPSLSVSALQGEDSLHVVVNNENKVPFWYTIFSGNKVLLQGYATQLDTLIKHGISKAAHIRTSYFWDENEKTAEVSAIYNPTELNVKLIAPPVVYPGQKVNLLVKVTDVNNLPSVATDLTAYAITSKFGSLSTPNLGYYGKAYKVRKRNKKIEADEISVKGDLALNWEQWGKKLGLDTVEYYHFIRPDGIYTSVENTGDTITQVAPFVIDKGKVDPVNIVYVDGTPVYYNQSDQLQRYAFQVTPGNHHIELRTATKTVQLQDFYVERGKKTIVSIAADTTNLKADVHHEKGLLSEQEADELNKYMIRIANNFGAEKTTIFADDHLYLLNPPSKPSRNTELLLGPFNENILSYTTKDFSHNFIKEPGYTYTFLPDLLKQKSYTSTYAFNLRLTDQPKDGNDSYLANVLKRAEIDSIWSEYLDLRSRTTRLFEVAHAYGANSGQFKFEIPKTVLDKLPYLKNIIIYKPDEPDFIQIYNGDETDFNEMNIGIYKVMFLLKDNRYFTVSDVSIKADGVNFYKWDAFQIMAADRFSKDLDQYIKSVSNQRNAKLDERIMDNFNAKNFDRSSLKNVMSGTVVAAGDGLPIPAATVKVVGLGQMVYTDVNGNFAINVPANGRISVSCLGFTLQEITIRNGNVGRILLKEDSKMLNEVVVTGYGSVSKSLSISSSIVVSDNNLLAGKLQGVQIKGAPGADQLLKIRGLNSLSNEGQLLYVIDGVVILGNPDESLMADVDDVMILKDAASTAIYGAQAANGVIVITTKKGKLKASAVEILPQQQTMRTNFSDEGFWKPKLITDASGVASFSVTFPDDITNWKARVIAINGNKQSGFTETSIKSFKTLSANFVAPLFAVDGDSINVIGKLMNYGDKEETVTRKLLYNGKEMRNAQLKFKNAYIDTAAIHVIGTDSLKFEYTLKQDNGYFDGEIRKIPVYEQGIKETKGYFSALLNDTTVNYQFDKNLGKITLRAESSVFPTLLDEMAKLRNYEYLCNEQLASKLKSLLLEKQVRAYLKEPFTHEKDMQVILKKLQDNKKPQGTWGWWQNSEEEIWISLHAVEALLLAEKQGYAVNLNKKTLYTYLLNKLANRIDFNELQTVKLMNLLDNKNYIKDWLVAIEKTKPAQASSLHERLQLMRLKQLAGASVNTDSLLNLKKLTMFGNMYWGEENNRFWDNSIQQTVLVYQILKATGKYKPELAKIQQYFLEQRKDGQWRNTYESSLILETILPEMLVDREQTKEVALALNGQKISKFPFSQILEAANDLKIAKTGTMPVYFTAYQQYQNSKPEKVGRDFTVNSSFVQKGVTVNKLKAGTLTILKVEVDVRADADYVMIEVPIPAGCSYENKIQNFWGIETHREYFKHKTSIFCTKLKKGKYTFTIDLMPRYGGNYILNPAKAEMMYFPVFFGREGMKSVGIN